VKDVKVAGLIAAAGRSERMGMIKALLEHPEGGSFVRNLTEVFRAAGLDPIIVTIPEGPHGDAVKREVALGVHALRNEIPSAGLSGSVYTAMKVAEHAPGLVITPVDAPFASVRDVRALADALKRHAGAVVTHQGKAGHPVAFRMERLHMLAQVKGGPKALFALGDIVDVPSEDHRVLANINTPGDLETWGIEVSGKHRIP
jgi:CTP:molybdopterin cytidylyltransferase MocA